MNIVICSMVVFIGFSLPLIIQDLKSYSITPIFIYCGFFLLSLIKFFFLKENVLNAFYGALFELSLYVLIWVVSKKKLGVGDIKYSAFCGLFIGDFWAIILANLFTSFLGISVYIFLVIFRKKREKIKIPFVPFMFLGSLVVSFFSYFKV